MMRSTFTYCAAVAICAVNALHALAQYEVQQPRLVAPATHDDSYNRPDSEASPSDQAAHFLPIQPMDHAIHSASCGCEPACGCEEPSCGCDNGCCSSSCGGSSDYCLLGDCCLGDAWTLKDELCPGSAHNFGGWIQFGYHTDNTGLSSDRGDLLDFNDVPHDVNLQQAWLYFEKVAVAGGCNADWGYRFDVVYGTDAQKTQAFGNSGGTWDVTFDHGVYGWAMPQAYAEVAYGDWSFKAGHFFTLVGYEVVTAPDNFFYSHALTMFNSEPFTHTGVLGSYSLSDDTTLHIGWVLGWDTGFDQLGGGNAVHAGFIHQATDDVSISYMMTGGNLGWRGEGYSHSVVIDANLSGNLNYVLQSDYVNVSDAPNGVGIAGVEDNEDVGVNQYLFYTVNDCWAVGGRAEWWKSNSVTGESSSFYELTGGVNYRPHANVVVRPEFRYDWTPSDEAADLDNREIFGIDVILTY